MATITTGAQAPDFELSDLGGVKHRLADELEKGAVALFFFKADCGATDVAAPFVESIWQGYREHESAEETRLSVFAISQEGQGKTAAFAQRFGFNFPVLVDENLDVSRSYDLEATPTLLLLSGRERLRADSETVDPAKAFHVVDAVMGWSLEGYELFSDEIAVRIGTLPHDLREGMDDDVPALRPG